MNIGILGGTFNPIHLAHLRIAEEARDRCALDRVVFMPAAIPPHKELDGDLSFEHRYAMVRLAVADHPLFEVSDLEMAREGRSYTIHTVETLQRLRPADRFTFIIGSDSYRDIASWYRYEEIMAAVDLAVVERPDAPLVDLTAPLPVAIRHQFCYDASSMRLTHRSGFSVSYLAGVPLAISSSAIRALVREGRSLRYLVPPPVEDYLLGQRIYHPCTSNP
jgi:nicotinate-nucleotide adenylyltransferase